MHRCRLYRCFDTSNNIEARCKVSPKWIETAQMKSNWRKLSPRNGWRFPRRVVKPGRNRGVPAIPVFPVKINNSKNGCIDTEIMIRRLNFPADLIDTDIPLYNSLVKALDGRSCRDKNMVDKGETSKILICVK